MRIERIDQLSGSPAGPIAMEGLEEMRRRETLDEACCGLAWNAKALLAIDDSCPIGVMVYTVQEWKRGVSIDLGYVRSDNRRPGVYTALWRELLRVCEETKLYRIRSTVHLSNEAMLDVSAHQGRCVQCHTVEYRLHPLGSELDEEDTADANDETGGDE